MTIEPDPYAPTMTNTRVVDSAGRPVVATPATTVAPGVAATAPVVDHVVVPAASVHQTVATSYGRRYALDSVVVGLVGMALLLMGLVAMTRAGFDGSMREPVVEVVGFTHTATLGIIEAALGVCLLLCAATTTRSGSVFFGVLLFVGAFVGAVQTESFRDSLALESGLAWLVAAAAILVVLASLLVPRMVTRTDRVEAI
jgi:hypothetical protein